MPVVPTTAARLNFVFEVVTSQRPSKLQVALSESFAKCFLKFGLRQVARNAREIWVHPGR